MDMAHLVSTWTSCYTPGRAIGAVIVKDKRVMTTGYNGAPAGLPTCKERGECLRRKLGVASGTHAEICYAVHAEQNASIRRVVYEQGYPDDFSLQLFHDAQIPIEQYDPATGGTTPC